MIKNYIKTAFRNLLKRKTFTLIHILGLGLAFGAAIILFLTAMFEISFDNFHVNGQKIELLYKESNPLNGREYSENVPPPLGPALKSDIPAIEKISRFGSYGAVLRHEDKQFSVSARFVDPDFLEMFSFPAITGSTTQALHDPESVVITSRMAKNLYESTDVVGQLIELRIADTWATAQITAVLDEIPNNSSIDFDVLFRFEKMPGYQSQKDNWHHNNHSVFVQMAGEKLNPEVFQNQSRSFVAKHLVSQVDNLKRESALPDENGEYLTLNVLPLKDYHLNDLRIGGGGPPKYPWILILLAGLILFLAPSLFITHHIFYR